MELFLDLSLDALLVPLFLFFLLNGKAFEARQKLAAAIEKANCGGEGSR